MPIARMHAVVLDCPDPPALAGFYQALVGGEVEVDEDDGWATLRGDGVALDFQRVDDYAPPTWPEGGRPQQFHIDVHIDGADLERSDAAVLALGAVRHEAQPGEAGGDPWRVFLDPAGHPFCLCW